MLIWSNPFAALQNVGVLLFENFSNHCLANAVEPLRAANMISRRTLYRWRFLTIDGLPVSSSSGLQVAPHEKFGREGQGDLLFVMPSYAYLSHVTPLVLRGLRQASKRYSRIAGFDTGSWLLAESGLLDGKRATIHWEEISAFHEHFPEVIAERCRYVVDGNRLTCSGAMAAFDLVSQLVGEHHGEALALDVAALFMRPEATGQHMVSEQRYSQVITRALTLMQVNLEDPLPIPKVAKALGRTQRNLENRFRAELGATPAQVYKRLRLGLARKLVEETELSISEIAVRSGYVNPSAMTRAFRLEFEHSPRTFRSI